MALSELLPCQVGFKGNVPPHAMHHKYWEWVSVDGYWEGYCYYCNTLYYHIRYYYTCTMQDHIKG